LIGSQNALAGGTWTKSLVIVVGRRTADAKVCTGSVDQCFSMRL
jgi:hypothetical protein